MCLLENIYFGTHSFDDIQRLLLMDIFIKLMIMLSVFWVVVNALMNFFHNMLLNSRFLFIHFYIL